MSTTTNAEVGADGAVIDAFIAEWAGRDPGEAIFDDAIVAAMARIRARSAAEYHRRRVRMKTAGTHYMTLQGLDAATGKLSRAIRRGETVEAVL